MSQYQAGMRAIVGEQQRHRPEVEQLESGDDDDEADDNRAELASPEGRAIKETRRKDTSKTCGGTRMVLKER
jgi:hypothetical protein